MTYAVLSTQQSLFDIAVILYGNVEGVHWLVDDNPGLGLTDRLQAGQLLTVRADSIIPRMVEYLSDFTTPQTIDEPDRPRGVGYWRVSEYVIQ